MSLFVIAFVCISCGVDLAIPKKSLAGLGYEDEIKHLYESFENPKYQGPLLSFIFIVGVYCVLLDSIGQQPVYTENFYIILPFLMVLENVLSILCL